MGALHSIDAKDLRRLRGPVQLARRRLDDVVAIDDLERVDRGLTAHDTVEGAVAHKHVDRVVDGLGRNERTSTIVNGNVFKARRNRMHAIWAPYTTVMYRITGSHSIASITVKVADGVMPLMAERNITRLLTARHGSKDFSTFNTDSIRQTIESATGTMTLLITGIALIALVVGGIGVMNIMLVSVTERTREIGLRMAVGARRVNIMEQFLLEAVLICLVGSVAGIALAGLISVAASMLSLGFSLRFSMDSILLAVACSSLIGTCFGFVPARNASRLNPIEALSRE